MAGDEGGRLNACTHNIVYKYISHYICNYAFLPVMMLTQAHPWRRFEHLSLERLAILRWRRLSFPDGGDGGPPLSVEREIPHLFREGEREIPRSRRA